MHHNAPGAIIHFKYKLVPPPRRDERTIQRNGTIIRPQAESAWCAKYVADANAIGS